MDFLQTDWLLVLVAALLNMAIGFVWFSKWLFGPACLKLSKMKEREKKKDKKAFLWGFLLSLVIAYFLSFFEGHVGVINVLDGMVIGFLLWLGFAATTEIGAVIWCEKPIRLFAIETGYRLLSYLVMSGVIAA